jgi:hypothetical protein
VRKPIMIAVAAMAMALAIPAVASADTYSTGFEDPPFTGSASPGTTVNGRDGWQMTAINGSVYDQGIVTTGISGSQSLRQSNAVATGDFAGQTHSPLLTNAASESGSNHVFEASFKVKSATGTYQPGLAVSVSPDDGIGGRMSYVRFEDEPNGIGVYVVDNPTDANQRQVKWGTLLDYTTAHTVTFKMQLVPGTKPDGSSNDIVRVIVDGHDIGEETHTCFTSWEQWFRHGENREPPVTNSLIVMARGASQDSTTDADSHLVPDYGAGGVAGNGYLFDDVSFESRDSSGPAPTKCGVTGAFCSPGYWKNAPNAAWAKVLPITRTSTFNSLVVPDFYPPAIVPSGTTLTQVLNASATKYGKAAGLFGLNPYNAVGAALTSKLPGYVFDPATIGLATACPLDGNGNWKPGAGPTS